MPVAVFLLLNGASCIFLCGATGCPLQGLARHRKGPKQLYQRLTHDVLELLKPYAYG